MQGTAWVSLLRRIPAAQHDSLLLMTTTGTEIFVQRVLRLEDDILVILGRLSGSTEQAKALIIPYDQLTYLAFNKKLTEAEMETVLAPAGAAAPVKALEEPAAAPTKGVAISGQNPKAEVNGSAKPSKPAKAPAPAESSPPGTTAAPPMAKPNPKGSMPSRSVLLARLRQRLTDEAGKQPKP